MSLGGQAWGGILGLCLGGGSPGGKQNSWLLWRSGLGREFREGVSTNKGEMRGCRSREMWTFLCDGEEITLLCVEQAVVITELEA